MTYSLSVTYKQQWFHIYFWNIRIINQGPNHWQSIQKDDYKMRREKDFSKCTNCSALLLLRPTSFWGVKGVMRGGRALPLAVEGSHHHVIFRKQAQTSQFLWGPGAINHHHPVVLVLLCPSAASLLIVVLWSEWPPAPSFLKTQPPDVDLLGGADTSNECGAS